MRLPCLLGVCRGFKFYRPSDWSQETKGTRKGERDVWGNATIPLLVFRSRCPNDKQVQKSIFCSLESGRKTI